jgi:transcriptional regulator with XRE-family HTH domain
VTPDQWQDRVGEPIRRRREQLRLSVRGVARVAGISEGLWRQVESGRRVLAEDVIRTVSPKPATRAAIAVALGWTPDSIDRLIAGGEPALAAPSAGDTDDEVAAQLAELEERVVRLEQRSVADHATAVDQMTIVRTPSSEIYLSAADADEIEGVSQLPRVDPIEFLLQRQAELAGELRALAEVVTDLSGVVKAQKSGRGSAGLGR